MSKYHDGCEWNPKTMSGAYESDTHFRETRATMLVGADGQWRLCRSCAELPYFARYNKKPIKAAPSAFLHEQALKAAEQRGRDLERAEIVEWLREPKRRWDTSGPPNAATRIEEGEHRPAQEEEHGS